jgi:hypothetical protein
MNQMAWFLSLCYPSLCWRSLYICFGNVQSLTRKPFNWPYRRPVCETTEQKSLCVSSCIDTRHEDSGNYGLWATDRVPCVEKLTFQMNTRHIVTQISSKTNSWIKHVSRYDGMASPSCS